jgi:prepilin-type N-terminal cleavage/methylation domain-containing protein
MKLFTAPFKRTNKGFTLIELLIVIALLGALAVGLIGALDPFEQLKKGTDTGTRDIVSQVQTAIIRYYSIKNDMPWAAGTDPDKTDLATAPMVAAITVMGASGEMRSDFATLQSANLTKVFVTGSRANSTVAVCYKPTSKSFQADPNTKYNQDGTEATAGTCKSAGGATACYWCIQ